MAVHIAYIGMVNIDAVGNVIDKSTATIAQVAASSAEPRVLYNATYAPNAANNPTVEEYLTLEDSAGYTIVAVTNTMIVTQN